MTTRAGFPRSILRHRGVWIVWRQDGVNAVAIRACWRQLIAAAQCLTMDTLEKNMLDLAMTFAAGRGNIEFVDRRGSIVCRQNLVRAMAIRADRRSLRAIVDRSPMHTVLIRRENLGADAAPIHRALLSMAITAGCGNVSVTHRRLGVAYREYVMRTTMAIYTGRRRRSIGSFLLRMETVLIGLRRICVTINTRNFFGLCLVWRLFYILMTIHAAEHRSVDGSLHLLRIDVEADLLAIHILGQRRIGVAGETVRVLRFLRGLHAAGPG